MLHYFTVYHSLFINSYLQIGKTCFIINTPFSDEEGGSLIDVKDIMMLLLLVQCVLV